MFDEAFKNLNEKDQQIIQQEKEKQYYKSGMEYYKFEMERYKEHRKYLFWLIFIIIFIFLLLYKIFC